MVFIYSHGPYFGIEASFVQITDIQVVAVVNVFPQRVWNEDAKSHEISRNGVGCFRSVKTPVSTVVFNDVTTAHKNGADWNGQNQCPRSMLDKVITQKQA